MSVAFFVLTLDPRRCACCDSVLGADRFSFSRSNGTAGLAETSKIES